MTKPAQIAVVASAVTCALVALYFGARQVYSDYQTGKMIEKFEAESKAEQQRWNRELDAMDREMQRSSDQMQRELRRSADQMDSALRSMPVVPPTPKVQLPPMPSAPVKRGDSRSMDREEALRALRAGSR